MKKLLVVLLVVVLAVSAFAGYSHFDKHNDTPKAEKNSVHVQEIKSQEPVHEASEEPEKAAKSVPVQNESVKPVENKPAENSSKKPVEKQSEKATPSPVPKPKVSKEDAKAAALKHAGLNENEVKFFKVELDRERNGLVYEIEFDSGKYEYEYDVNSESGKVLKSEKEFRD